MRILLALGLAAVIAVSAQAATSTPHLWILGDSPLVVRGTGFHAREHVVLRATFGASTVTKTVVATAGGGFSASIQLSTATQCGQLFVTARGATGSKASTKPPRESCGIEPAPLEP